ncbi:hypothetical protein OGR47_02585 [Methylocystis sp. MJC1]|uniref:hypothetical protein n=1 Tax=Methylocystis sp. MJC1 TaxID=2654282 RepID=UPI0013EC71F4|nr:hypothetical protein [Methylocystis sp. MJC1]KAF2989146.1 hypothetical protein MJC1_03728 [Methylocystis sp. MJC1]MBU6525899.1 hypothetical protein [Methylocystis sp. MJC1]UZX12366.1 hypothetical protein OGR47_02585 [Methylocystis sp. MJC1]
MMKLPSTINRHVVGASAILAALVVLGYAANSINYRRVASLPEADLAIAQNISAETPWNENFLSQLKQVPPNAYGSARGSEETLGQKLKEGITAMIPSVGSPSAQTASKNWSDEEWQIAEKAVADHRGPTKASNSNNASVASKIIWQPPEEIANGRAGQ